jgi:hypothetical protein
MSINNSKYYYFSFFLFFTGLVCAQNSANGKILEAKTNKEISGVDIFINDSEKPTLTTTTGNFSIQSDSIIYKLKFLRKNYALESVDITAENANNLFVKLSQEKVESIQEVVIHNEKPKYKNKKENPAYAIMQEVWKRKRNNGLDKFDTYTYKEYEKIQFDANNLDSTFMKRKIFNKLDFIYQLTAVAVSSTGGPAQLTCFFSKGI